MNASERSAVIAPPGVVEQRPRIARACCGVFVLSLTVRGLWVALAQVTPIGDHYGYDRSAVHWLETGEYRSNIPDTEYRVGAGVGPRCDDAPPPIRAYRTPGYIAFLAGLYAVFGHNWGVVAVAQAVLGALTSALVVAFGGRVVSPRVGWLAGLLHTFWPTALAYVPVLASDNLAVFLLLVGLNALVSGQRTRGSWSVAAALGAGLAGGAMFLTRPVTLFFLPAWLLLAWWDPALRQRRPRNLVVCAVGFAAVAAPWFIRNWALGYGLTTISTQGGYALWWGNNWRTIDGGNPAPPRFPGDRQLSELEQHRLFQHKALDWIISNPKRYLQLSAVRLARHFGTPHDVWAAKYFFPTPRNDELIRAVYWSGSYPPELVAAGRALENRNRRWHQGARAVVAPVMLLAALLAFRRPRRFAYVLLPLNTYALGLALTVFAGRYRLMSDPLLFVALGALLCDLVFGTHELGRWGGRWVKLALVVLAVAGSVAAHATGVDRTWYRLPPGWEPNPPTAHLAPYQVWHDVRAVRGIRPVASSSCQTDLNTDDAGIHCRLTDTSGDSARSYGGLRIPVPDFRTVGLDLTWHDAGSIDAILVIARGEQPTVEGPPRRQDVLRWQWSPSHPSLVPPAEKRLTYVLTPEGGTGHFVPRRTEASGETEPRAPAVDELRIVVRVKPGTSAGFTLHGLVLGRPPASPALREFGGLVTLSPGQVERLTTVSSRACQVNLGRHDDRVACELRAAPDARGNVYGGVRFGVPEAAAFELQLAFEQPKAIDRIFVIGYGPGNTEAARWEWPVAARRIYPVTGEPGCYTFVPGQTAGPFEARRATGGPLVEIRVLVRVLSGTTSRFAVHRVTLAVPMPASATAPGKLPLPLAIEPEAPEAVEPDGAEPPPLGNNAESEAASDEDIPDAPFKSDQR